jgi:hypothetical protein
MSVLDVVHQRRALTDALRPPNGYVLGACIGTTYSLDFDLFTAVLLAFVGADIDDPLNNPPAVLTSVARLQSRLRVYVNGASLHPPTKANRLFALYDRILRPRQLGEGAFHPKVWALRFDPVARPDRRGLEPIYRFLTASRNVTDSGCWELGALFEGSRRSTKQKFGSEVSGFCRKVAASRDLPKDLWRLIDELKNVEFTAPREAAKGMRFDWQWPDDRVLIDRLPRTLSRALLISPFLRASFLNALCDRNADLTLVSTQDELDALSENTYARIKSGKIFVVLADADEDVFAQGLHAKLLAWEFQGESETMVGSANATGPGWGCGSITNCEAMISLRPGLGIDAIAKAFVAPSKDQLYPWIETYVRKTEVTDPEQELTKRLEKFKRLLQADLIRGEYDGSKKELRLLASSTIEHWPVGMRVEIVPLLQRDQAKSADYRLMYQSGAVFAELELEDLAAFAYVVITNTDNKDVELPFVLQFELNLSSDDADKRDRAVNARLLEGVDARSLILDVLAGLPGGTTHSSGNKHSSGAQGSESLMRRASIERILEACTADPTRIHEVQAILAACSEDASMSAFREFWSVFRESLEEDVAGV